MPAMTGSALSARSTIRSTTAASSPVVPVVSATAATRLSAPARSGSSIVARRASWTGPSCWSRSASSSDGTPRPPSRSARRRQMWALSRSSRSSQSTRVS